MRRVHRVHRVSMSDGPMMSEGPSHPRTFGDDSRYNNGACDCYKAFFICVFFYNYQHRVVLCSDTLPHKSHDHLVSLVATKQLRNLRTPYLTTKLCIREYSQFRR